MIDMDQKAQTHSVILRLNILISKYMNLDDIGRVPFRDADRQGEGDGHCSPPAPKMVCWFPFRGKRGERGKSQ